MLQRFVYSVGFFLLLCALRASAGGVPDSHQPLIDRLKPINGFSGSFEQTLVDANGDQIQQTRGTLTAVKPGLLRWHAEPPYEQLIVVDGERMWLYDPDLQQVTTQGYRNDLARTPAMLLVGETEGLRESYQVFREQTDDGERFTLIPRDNGSLYSKILLGFVGNTPVEMVLWDSLEQRTRIRFKDVVLNPTAEAGLFTFQAPPDADVIYND